MSLFGTKKINAFGLDISDTSVKIIQLKRASRRIGLHAYSDTPLAENVINNHMIVNEKKLAENITRGMTQARRIDTKYVVCSIPEAKSFVRTLEIPKMPEAEIQNAVPYELEQDIPVPIDQVYLDWQIMRELPNSLKILVTATPKDYVDSLISVLHMLKLRPLALELESQATARALIAAPDATKPILIIDLSTTQTSFVIVQNGIIEYTSSVPIAGRAFTESIARVLGVSVSQAENLKRTAGLSVQDPAAPVRQAITPVLDSIVEETKKVIRFFDEHSDPKVPIETIMLCGGTAQLLGITDYISAHLDVEPAVQRRIILGNPWANVELMAKKPGASVGESLGFVTAAGLALRGCEYENN